MDFRTTLISIPILVLLLCSGQASFGQNPFDIAAKGYPKHIEVSDSNANKPIPDLIGSQKVVQIDSQVVLQFDTSKNTSPSILIADSLGGSDFNNDFFLGDIINGRSTEKAINQKDEIAQEKNKDRNQNIVNENKLRENSTLKKFLSFSIESSAISNTQAKYFSFLFVIFVLGLTAFLFNYDRSVVNRMFEASINSSMAKILYREDYIRIKWLFHVHYFVFFLSAGFILYKALSHFVGIEKWWYLPVVICIVMFVYLIKHFVVFIMTLLSKQLFDVKFYAYQIEHLNIVLGILLVPFVLILAVTNGYVFEYSLYVCLGLICIFYFYRQIRAFFFSVNLFATHTFHFFIYLCALEILPVAILVKYVVGLTV